MPLQYVFVSSTTEIVPKFTVMQKIMNNSYEQHSVHFTSAATLYTQNEANYVKTINF